ncbi:MAG: inositol monophosphatase family protein [Dehalococcoidia bacterium]
MAIATQAARESGRILKDYYYQTKRIESKGNRNLLTEVDLLSEKNILKILHDEFPDHSILCEESGENEKAGEYQWIVDPLDGTTNYAFGIGHFCVSVALARDDEVLLGVIYDPLRDELFRAQKGEGAYLNDSPIAPAGERDLRTKLVGFDLGYSDSASREMLSRANQAWHPEVTFRLMGSAALGITYVACGRLDIYFHRSIYPWDIAAAVMLIREAGGEIIDGEGNPATLWSKRVIACGDFKEHRGLIAALN